MTLLDQTLAQLADPFRIGLIVALIITAIRTEAATGKVIPLILGVLFIAVMIPMTTQADASEPVWLLAATGIIANAILLAMALAVWSLVHRFRR